MVSQTLITQKLTQLILTAGKSIHKSVPYLFGKLSHPFFLGFIEVQSRDRKFNDEMQSKDFQREVVPRFIYLLEIIDS